MKNKKEKIGLTPVSLILSILAILIFASFIVLPPVFRTIFKKEVIVEAPEEKIIIETMVCTRNNYNVGNHNEDNIITLTYTKDSLRMYKKETTENFDNTISYENEKQVQGKLTTAYSLLNGVTYNVSPKDSVLKVIISEDYDLGLFEAEDVTLPDEDEVIEIKDTYNLGDSVSGIVSSLSSSGYTCQKETQ